MNPESDTMFLTSSGVKMFFGVNSISVKSETVGDNSALFVELLEIPVSKDESSF